MTPEPSTQFLRPLVWSLRTVTSRARCEAILGDIDESLPAALTAGRRSCRANLTLCRYLALALLDSLPHVARTTGFLLRDAVRGLRSSAGTTTLAFVILASAVSVATVTYSIVDAVVLKPLPFAEPDRLVMLQRRLQGLNGENGTTRVVHAAMFEALRHPPQQLAGVGGYSTSSYRLASGGLVRGAEITASLFPTLGTAPLLGAGFSEHHESASTNDVVILSYDFWQQHLGGRPDVIGTGLILTKRPHRVVGVMPRGFVFPIDDEGGPQVWTPFVAPAPADYAGDTVSARFYLTIVGRLTPGVPIAEAADAAQANVTAFAPSAGRRLTNTVVHATPLAEAIIGPVRDWMLLALCSVIAVVLIACANVANLLMARSARRTRELSLRASLGASHRFLAATAIGEGVLLSLLAGAAALLATWWTLEAARAMLPEDIARTSAIVINGRVLVAALLTSLFTGVAFSAAPAREAARQDLRALVAGATRHTGRPSWRVALVGTQVAFVTLLMIVSTLFVASFIRVITKDLGFSRRGVLAAERDGITTPAYDVARRLDELAGVDGAGGYFRGDAPLTGGGQIAARVWRPGGPHAVDGAEMQVHMSITPGYLPASGARFLEGRDFEDGDLGRADRVIIDSVTARRLYGDASAIGQPIAYGLDHLAAIVGVVAGMRTEGPEAPPTPMFYLPLARSSTASTWLVRTSGDTAAVSTSVSALLDGLAPPASPATTPRRTTVTSLEAAFRDMTRERRFVAGVMSLFGLLALAIGLTGVYGVLWSTISQRTREFAIRSALGGSRRHIVGAILRDTVRMVTAGLALGLLLGVAAGRTIAALLFETRADAPAWYVVVAFAMLIGCVAAALIPARRAASIDPQIVLRSE